MFYKDFFFSQIVKMALGWDMKNFTNKKNSETRIEKS